MKILHIVGDSKYGGGSVLIKRLAEEAQKLGWDADILTTDEVFIEKLTVSGIGVINLDVIWRNIKISRDIKGLLQLYVFLKKSDYTLVHTHTSKAGFIGRIAARLAGIPVVVHTVHGFAFHDESSTFEKLFYTILERVAASFCDQIYTVSEHHRKEALQYKICSPEKVIAIPNGIDETRIKTCKADNNLREKLAIGISEFVVLSIGRMSKQKGFEYLIQAVPQIQNTLKIPVKVLLVGDGPLKEDLEQQVRQLGLEDSVMFLGFRDDIGALFSTSDVVVLPSLWEGLSIALLEAMASSKPIVTTTISSNLEVIEDGVSGLLVPPKAPNELARAVCSIANNSTLKSNLGRAARLVFESRYTEERMLGRYVKEYLSQCQTKKLEVSEYERKTS